MVSFPPLRSGDRLTRDEFLRRWEAQPHIKFAELIGGYVYMPAPVSIEQGRMRRWLSTWLGIYQVATQGTDGADNATTFLIDDAPQPDLNLRVLPEYGGGCREDDRYLRGAPEFVAQLAARRKA